MFYGRARQAGTIRQTLGWVLDVCRAQWLTCFPGSRILPSWRINRGCRSVSTELTLGMPAASLGCSPYFWSIGCKSEVPTTPSWGSISLLEELTELRKTCLLTRLPTYYKRILKDIHQQSDKIHGLRSYKGTSVVMADEAEHGGMWKCSGSPTWKISEKDPKSCPLELFMEASLHGYD